MCILKNTQRVVILADTVPFLEGKKEKGKEKAKELKNKKGKGEK
jgi:hypothetical protein